MLLHLASELQLCRHCFRNVIRDMKDKWLKKENHPLNVSEQSGDRRLVRRKGCEILGKD